MPCVRGAELAIEARPGLTAEWLELELERHVAAASPDCPLDVGAPRVTVRSARDGFVVEIRGDSDAAAREILRRARGLVAGR